MRDRQIERGGGRDSVRERERERGTVFPGKSVSVAASAAASRHV